MYIYQQHSDYHQIIRISEVRLSEYQNISVWVLSAWMIYCVCLLLKNQQIKNTKNDFQCLKFTLSDNKKVDIILIMWLALQVAVIKRLTEGVFYAFRTGWIFKILSHLPSFYSLFSASPSRFGSYMRLFSHFHFRGA